MIIGLFCILLLPSVILAGGVKGGDSKGGGCVYSDWSQWSVCSVTCGDGLQNRIRNLISGPFCQITSETRACNQGPCVVKSDCVMSEWSQWSVCNKQCGTGKRERTRSINKPAVGGAACETTVEVQNCNTQACGVDCAVGDWGVWSACSAICNGGKRSRTRPITVGPSNGGAPCPATQESQDCNPQPCPVDCVLGDWSAWGSCSVSCGGGKRTRTRVVTKQPVAGGKACDALSQEESCNIQACPVDCAVTSWGAWSTCSKPCGGGLTQRSRSIFAQPIAGGKACPGTLEILDCNTQSCAVDCVMTQWSQWSQCSSSCGGGRTERTRTITVQAANGGRACESTKETQVCNPQSCPVDCVMSAWSEWSKCSVSCGGGRREQIRTVTVQAANGGRACESTIKYEDCNVLPCPVDCVMSQWSEWSKCSVSCGGGRREATRIITVQASNGGKACDTTAKYETCNSQACPVDCVMSTWSEWSKCSTSCGGGRRESIRTVTVQAANGGKACESTVKYEDCNIQPCPVDCVMSAWSEWSQCSVSCGIGRREQRRTITTQASFGGKACDITLKYENCNTQACPVDCVMGPWSEWSKCSASCGGGRREKVRSISVQASFGGKSCDVSVQYEACNSQSCAVDCVMGAWSQWSQCSASCGGGRRESIRTVTVQAANGGKACESTVKYEDCNTQKCAVDCVMSQWSQWSQCSASCGGGRRESVRTVTVASAFGGKACEDTVKYETCNTQQCSVDCVMGPWSEFSACSATCGGGRKERVRKVLTPASNGGKPCEDTILIDECNSKPCAKDCVMGPWSEWGVCSKTCGNGQQARSRAVATPASNGGAQCPPTIEVQTCATVPCPGVPPPPPVPVPVPSARPQNPSQGAFNPNEPASSPSQPSWNDIPVWNQPPSKGGVKGGGKKGLASTNDQSSQVFSTAPFLGGIGAGVVVVAIAALVIVLVRRPSRQEMEVGVSLL